MYRIQSHKNIFLVVPTKGGKIEIRKTRRKSDSPIKGPNLMAYKKRDVNT